jgi:hypothetical protein
MCLYMCASIVRSEPLGPQQRVSEVKQQPRGNEAGERVIEHHGLISSKPFAGVAVTHRRREERKAEGQHDDVKHGMLLMRYEARHTAFAFLLSDELPPGAYVFEMVATANL